MEIPYPILLRVSWELWWRFLVCLAVVAFALLAPLVVAGFFYPILWEALAASKLDRELVLFGVLPAFQLLVCFPMAVRWLLRKRAAELGLAGRYTGSDPAVRDSFDRQIFVLSWAIFWMPFLWTMANALVVHLLFPSGVYPMKTVVGIVLLFGNVALVMLVAILPMNVSWAIRNKLLGVEWTLDSGTGGRGSTQGR